MSAGAAVRAIDHGKTVIGTVLASGDVRWIDHLAGRGLEPEHFADPVQGTLFALIVAYARRSRGVLPRSALADMLKGEAPGKAEHLAEYYDLCVKSSAGDVAAFTHAAAELAECHAEQQTGQILAAGAAILNGGHTLAGRTLRGPAEARRYVIAELSAIGKPQDGPALLPAIPAYPSAAISGPLAGLVTSSALPDALLGGAGLAVLSVLCGNAEVVLPGGDTERPALWVALIAPTGGGKSPVLDKRALAPLFPLDQAARETYEGQVRAWKAADRETRGERPADYTLLSEDFTVESLARLLNRRPGGITLLCQDELDALISAIGQYKKASGDKAKIMQLWNARRWIVQRVGNARDSEDLGVDFDIPRTCVTIVGGLQPHLHHILGDEASGFRARWLPHLSDAEPVEWDSWSQAGRAAWSEAVGRLHADRGRHRIWTLSEDAAALWREAQDRWKAAGADELSASAKAALKKADLHAARVAVVQAEAATTGTGITPGEHGHLVSEAAMADAVAIVGYALDVLRALPSGETYAPTARDREVAGAVGKLLAAVETRAGKKMTRREIIRYKVAGVSNGRQADEVLRAYEETYPGCVRDEVSGGWDVKVAYAPPRGQ